MPGRAIAPPLPAHRGLRARAVIRAAHQRALPPLRIDTELDRRPRTAERAEAVAQPVVPYRRPSAADTSPAAAEAANAPAQAGDQDRASTPLTPASPDFLGSLAALQALDAQLTGETALDAERTLPTGLQLQPPAASPLGPTDRARVPQGDPLTPAIVRTPDDPPGWERIYEGSFLEAVLVNQLNGDFPGPVLAAVAVPVYWCFRHQLLLPRPYLVLTKPLRLDIQCQRAASVKIGWKYLDD